MIVCICCNLNTKKVQNAIRKGKTSKSQIFSHYEKKPQCGKCFETIQNMLEDVNEKCKLF